MELAWHQGMAWAELGEWNAAVPLLTEATERRARYPRAHYNDLAHLLDVLVYIDSWNEVEPVILSLMERAGEIGSTRTANLILRTTSRIERSRQATSTAGDSAAELQRTLMHTSASPLS